MFSSLYFLIVFGSYIHTINAIIRCTRPVVWQTVTVLENATKGHNVFVYAATDSDGKYVMFWRVGRTNDFVINGNNLIVDVPLDFETKQQFLVDDVYARHRETTVGQDRCNYLTVNVLPVNEFTPVFNPSLLIVNISEGLQQNTVISSLNCTDEDKEPFGSPEGCSKITIQSGDDTNPRFAIANNTVVTTNNVIDYDTGDVTFTLIIVGIDSSTLDPQKTGSMTLIINIVPVNEFTPSFENLPLLTSIQETTPVGNEILRVNAFDNDTGPHGDVTYKITAGNTDGIFLISETSGKMYLRRPLDFDSASGSVYNLTLEASDGELTSTAVVTVTITDVNDNIPQCTPLEFNVTIDEDLKIGSQVTTVNCTDNDRGTSLAYKILSGDKGYFQITTSGDIIVVKELPYDDGISAFYMKIQISDGLYNTSTWVLVLLNPVNEYPPTALNPKISVSELMDVGDEMMTYVADDKDAPPHHITSYRKIGVKNGDRNSIHVDKKTGKIFLTSHLDYEKTSQFKIVIQVKDGGGLSATSTVTVNIINDNNYPPFCMKTDEIISIRENTAIGKEILTDFECTDRDKNPLTFFLTTNPDDGAFSIDSVTRNLKVKGLVDYETTPYYSMMINVSDGQLSTEIKIIAYISNVNDHSPEFKDKDISATVSEGDKPGTYVTRLSASDEDKDSLIYSFVGIYPEFMIDSNKGIIRLRTMVDREKSSSVAILVQASDGEKSSTATVTVKIGDVNEEPVFEKTLYEFYIDENDLRGSTIGKLSAMDLDGQSQNREVRYTIQPGIGKSYVTINTSSGLLSLDAPVDFEREKALTFVVQASDSGVPPLSSFCTVIVHIRDRNDNAPIFLSPRLFETISEGTSFGAILTRVVATDMDSTSNNNNMIFYQSASSVPFAVDQLTGDVTVSRKLDRETHARYEMIITATDNGSPRLTGTLTLNIEITDINDNNPIVMGQYIKTLPENVPVKFEVFKIIADDADEDVNGKLKYETKSSEMNSIFTLGENTGSLQIASPLDRESYDRYDVIIRVSDSGRPPRSTTVTAIIYISDVNDMAPHFTKPIYEFSLPENVVQTVGIMSATDKDSGFNSLVTYSIATYLRGILPRFMIDSKTGKIYTTGKLDREMEDEYSLLIRAKDSGTPSLWSDVTVNIKIEDVNDNQPRFRHSEFSTSIFENLTIGTNFLSTGATDVDFGDNAVITYELDVSTQNGQIADYYFGVHRSTGNIFLSKSIDREVYQSFALTVIARDNGIPSLWNYAQVYINIDDVNDNAPVFSPVFYNTEVSSNNLCDAVLATVTASDADLDRNAAINYELQKNDASVPFSISHLGAVTANQDLLHSKYVISVKAYDNGSPVLSSREPARVRIDRFEPDRVIFTFYMDKPMHNYILIETVLLRHIQDSLSVQYPKVYVRRWCIEESEYLLVHIYAVKNVETNDPKNIDLDKDFLTNGEVLDNLQLDQSQRPTVNVNDETWNYYGIKKVTSYGKETFYPGPSVSGLLDSSSDLAIPLGVSLTIVAMVVLTTSILLYIAWKRRWFRQSKNNAEEKTKFRGKITKKVEEESTPNLKESIRPRLNKLVSMETALNSDTHDPWHLASIGNPEKRSVSGPYLRQPPMLINDQGMEAKSSPVSPRVSHSRGALSPAKVRKQDIVTKNHGVDIVTGWMYEEDPMTKVRKWIK